MTEPGVPRDFVRELQDSKDLQAVLHATGVSPEHAPIQVRVGPTGYQAS